MSNSAEASHSSKLVQRILTGDSQAESEMVLRYQDGLNFVLRQWSQDIEQIRDVSQDTWRIVLEKIRGDELKDHQKLAGFIVMIGKYQLIMSHRKNNARTFVSESDIVLQSPTSLQPQLILEKYKTTNLVKKLIDKLAKHRDRDILYRFYIEQDNKDSICEEYGLSELHFNRVIHRARQRFKKVWNTYSRDKET